MPPRLRRTQIRKLLRASLSAEERYARTLADIVRAAGERLRHAALGTRSDARASTHAGDIDRAFEALRKPLAKAVETAFHEMFAAVSRANAAGLSALGVPIRKDVGLARILDNAIQENVELIRKDVAGLAEEVRAIMGDPANTGVRAEELADEIRKRTGVAESRADLIARDQTLKANGNLTKARQSAAGISSYVWSTSRDDRVRPEHAALEGQTIEWSDPPEFGHPGEDIQCRCVAIPVIDAFADLD